MTAMILKFFTVHTFTAETKFLTKRTKNPACRTLAPERGCVSSQHPPEGFVS